jgi:hypothetical protein
MKPKLLFFQCKYDARLPKFVLSHQREHVKCLSQFFNVVVIDHDCDYQEVCDNHRPDLTLFESGIEYAASSRRPKITNSRVYPHIPKIGFLHSDAFAAGRAGFLSDMDHLGIETFFAIASAAAENTPAISDSLFTWPNFIDPDIYRDYGLWKSIPVLFTGNTTALYPWRQRMVKLISKNYPSLICLHPGFDPQKAQSQFIVGEPYARMLNSSLIVPSCGTLAKEVVRKHFEIPACNACLVTEPSRTLDAAGFVDMVNCVFAEEHDVLDKLSFLFDNADAREKIVRAGFELVHRRHTIRQRDQILQWYELNKQILPHQKIVQPGPFEPLQLADRSSGRGSSTLAPNGLHLYLLRQGDALLWQHDIGGAERCYLRCAQHIPWMPEPKFRIALCNLYKGKPKIALSLIGELIQFTLAEYGAIDPDPVEWAYLIVATICLGKLGEAIKRANQFGWLHHPELDRARRVVMFLSDRRILFRSEGGQFERLRRSIHQLPQRNDKEWLITLCRILAVCNQRDFAERLSNYLDRNGGALEDERLSGSQRDPIRQECRANGTVCSNDAGGEIAYFRRRLRYSKIRKIVKATVKRGLYSVEARCRYFLPHHLSSSRNDELYEMIYDLALEKRNRTVLVFADWRERCAQALIAGFREREEESRLFPSKRVEQSRVFCLKGRRHHGIWGRGWLKADFLEWYGPMLADTGKIADQLQSSLTRIKEDSNIRCFDMALVDRCRTIQDEDAYSVLYPWLREANCVVLNGVNFAGIHEIYRRLVREGRHCITSENPTMRDGYAVFEQRGFVEKTHLVEQGLGLY